MPEKLLGNYVGHCLIDNLIFDVQQRIWAQNPGWLREEYLAGIGRVEDAAIQPVPQVL
jgi:hypothetical protein